MHLRRALLAATVIAATLTGCNPQLADDKPAASSTEASATASPAAGGPAPSTGGLTLADAIAAIPKAEEHRDGYQRSAFKHWIDEDGDGCSTRQEVLIAEAVKKPEQGARCALSGGEWYSYYDEATVEDARRLDIDHVVPLAEAWDSGASTWDADRRMRYANDLAAPRSLVAVSAKENRSKGDRDPSEWMPSANSARCTYLADWTATKLRWGLSADGKERSALLDLSAECSGTTVEYEKAA